ncbi:MAG: hypothetical protein P8Y18_06575 [Candidatus Bathyarchaeota archaeon]
MLGEYRNFPKNIQGIARFEYRDPTRSIQKAILFTFHKLNQEISNCFDVTSYLDQNCEIGFEFGIADGTDFIFLDNKELERCERNLSENDWNSLDFFIIIRYYRIKMDNKRIPLKFDSHIIRFIFYKDFLELQIRHEKGPQRISLDDFADFMAGKINSELSRRKLSPILLEVFSKVGLN